MGPITLFKMRELRKIYKYGCAKARRPKASTFTNLYCRICAISGFQNLDFRQSQNDDFRRTALYDFRIFENHDSLMFQNPEFRSSENSNFRWLGCAESRESEISNIRESKIRCRRKSEASSHKYQIHVILSHLWLHRHIYVVLNYSRSNFARTSYIANHQQYTKS